MPRIEIAPQLAQRLAGNGSVQTTATGSLLSIQSGPAGVYRLAQLDDYQGLRRRDFLRRAPITMALRARVRGAIKTGTWGFGLWNDPFGVSLEPRGGQLLLPTAPQAAWFFWASPTNYLSFRDDRPGHGMMAQVFRSEPGWRWLAPAALAMVFRRRAARGILRAHIVEDSELLGIDPGSWHAYEIHWADGAVEFVVDGARVLRTAVAPREPLGIVIWIDNQFAVFDPSGRVAWGFEPSASDGSLEISDLRVVSTA